MSRSLGLALSLLLMVLAPAIVVGSMLAARVESSLASEAAEGGTTGDRARTADCAPPAGWVPVQAQTGEDLAQLGARSGTTVEAIAAANCLSHEIQPGEWIYLPSASGGSPTPCGPPADWVLRQVAEDEGLHELAEELDVSEAELRAANCLSPFTAVMNGVRLYVPPTATPRPTATPTASATPTTLPSPTMSATIQSP